MKKNSEPKKEAEFEVENTAISGFFDGVYKDDQEEQKTPVEAKKTAKKGIKQEKKSSEVSTEKGTINVPISLLSGDSEWDSGLSSVEDKRSTKLSTCPMCGKKFHAKLNNGSKISDKNYCDICYPIRIKENRDVKELQDYIFNLFQTSGISSDGWMPRIFSQLSKFRTKYNLKYGVILDALKYKYEILQEEDFQPEFIAYTISANLPASREYRKMKDRIINNFSEENKKMLDEEPERIEIDEEALYNRWKKDRENQLDSIIGPQIDIDSITDWDDDGDVNPKDV